MKKPGNNFEECYTGMITCKNCACCFSIAILQKEEVDNKEDREYIEKMIALLKTGFQNLKIDVDKCPYCALLHEE